MYTFETEGIILNLIIDNLEKNKSSNTYHMKIIVSVQLLQPFDITLLFTFRKRIFLTINVHYPTVKFFLSMSNKRNKVWYLKHIIIWQKNFQHVKKLAGKKKMKTNRKHTQLTSWKNYLTKPLIKMFLV